MKFKRRTRVRFQISPMSGYYARWPNVIPPAAECSSRAWQQHVGRQRHPSECRTLGKHCSLAFSMMKEKARHRIYASETRAGENSCQADPNFAPTICILGLIDAGLGRKKEALGEAQRALRLVAGQKDLSNGTRHASVWRHRRGVGWRKGSALQSFVPPRITRRQLSYGRLKLLPWWDPLRGDPRFEKIVADLAPKL